MNLNIIGDGISANGNIRGKIIEAFRSIPRKIRNLFISQSNGNALKQISTSKTSTSTQRVSAYCNINFPLPKIEQDNDIK